jgi:hypothetical protein
MNLLRPSVFLPASKRLVRFGTVYAARMDCESISLADGSAQRLSVVRTWARDSSWTVSTVPSSCQLVKYQYTVSRSGKSLGNCRPEHPVRTT